MPDPRLSFEFFPPADPAGMRELLDGAARLADFQPRFVSVTCGADGSTRTRTAACVARIREHLGLEVAPHLTCVGASREQVLDTARDYVRGGIRRLLVLRGDAPDPGRATLRIYRPHPEEFAYASELVEALREVPELEISVAAYPEVHPECTGLAAEIENLRRKQSAGASRAITQFFFEPDLFLRYRDACRRAGVHIPLVPGILPIQRLPQLLRFAARCGASVPSSVRRRFDGLEDDPAGRARVAAGVAIAQVERLRAEGVDEFHFYTLNRAELTSAVCEALGLERRTAPADAQCAAARMLRASPA